MKVSSNHELYDHSVTLSQTQANCLNDAIGYISELCGGLVWGEIETTEQPLPKYAKYVDTFYNINVYYDFVTETFFFEEFN